MRMNQQLSTSYNANAIETTCKPVTLPISYRISRSSTSNLLMLAEASINSFRFTSSASSTTLTEAPIAPFKKSPLQKKVEKKRALNQADYQLRRLSGYFKKAKSEEEMERRRASNRACYHRRKAELKRLETKEEKERKLALQRAASHRRKEKKREAAERKKTEELPSINTPRLSSKFEQTLMPYVHIE
ncbi:unnamed protein product [Orchesella dallaii]|uniref:Uncharacterized protein n=1 Tax=Orchesella dallaii TaxID=48710 RepID=A0ABP1R6Q9_9HEXA